MEIEIKIVQTQEMELDRLYSQIKMKKVDVGQYFGGTLIANAWNNLYYNLNRIIPDIPPDLIPNNNQFCPVILGVGNGLPSLKLLSPYLNKLSTLILIDTSLEMLNLAIAQIKNYITCPIIGLVANFILDQQAVQNILQNISEPKIFICLGYTVGNYNQEVILNIFYTYLNLKDQLLIEIAYFTSVSDLEKDATYYISQENCNFGLKWLEACGHIPMYRLTNATFEKDLNISEIFVIKGNYTFHNTTTLYIGKSQHRALTFTAGENIQFVETRRYLKNSMIQHFEKYKLYTLFIQHQQKSSFIMLEKNYA
ncbi:MAG: L-histidine N(alpha)-methyltransferase [Burkholderiales bacterium]|nr:L-histidine N(alpha)-methyltransferase [Burkholderiales bacterium]